MLQDELQRIKGVDQRQTAFFNSIVDASNATAELSTINAYAISLLDEEVDEMTEDIAELYSMAWESVSGLTRLERKIDNLSGDTNTKITELSGSTNAKITELSGTTATGLQQVNAKIDALTPVNPGEEGQILTMGFDDKTKWAAPAVSGAEYATVKLSTSGGTGSVSGVTVTVEVEGSGTTGYTTDANGQCSFAVAAGAIYNVTFGSIEGYAVPKTLSYRSTLASRPINVTYFPKSTVEHVRVYLRYDNTGSARATGVTVTTQGVSTSYAAVNDICEFDIPSTYQYTITYDTVSGYDTPASVVITATQSSRDVVAYYIALVTSMAWIKTDGTAVPFYDLATLQESEVLGLKIQTAALVGSGSRPSCAYVIPYEYLTGQQTIGGRQWAGQAVQFESIGNYSSETLATTDDGTNFDGQANTLAVIREGINKSIPTPTFDAVHAISYTIAGVTYNCFLWSYMQLKTFASNRNTINSLINSTFGRTVININSGDWWSSSQYSAARAVYLGNGGFNYDPKTLTSQCVPLLAY